MKIRKRDGRIVAFDQNKIIDAVLAAFKEVDGELSDYAYIKAGNIADYILEVAKQHKRDQYAAGEADLYLGVEDIQDLVEKGLMATKRKDVAKAYILYREARNKARTQNNTTIQAIGSKLQANDVENQNANVDEHSFGGRKGEAANVLMKQYALDYILSPMARENHLNNEVYIHDLDAYAVGMHNCLSVPFDDLLANGFNTRQTDVRPANSVNTAFQLVAVIFQLQSLQQFGGVSATHLDWTMVPYVRKSFWKHWKEVLEYELKWHPSEELQKVYDWEVDVVTNDHYNPRIDDLEFYCATPDYIYLEAMARTEKEVHQAVEGMYHNLNTLQSRSGNQLPFTSINYGTCTLPEGRMVTKALLEVSIEGLGRLHKTSIFPCGIFQCMKGVNREPGDPNYDLYRLALRSTATRLYPNYANVDWSGNAGYDRNDPRTYFSTMGCRTANGFDINGFGQLKDGRGNICPVTVILPTLAAEAIELADNYTEEYQMAHPDLELDIFFELLDKKIHDAKDMLLERFEYICSQPAASAQFMYENHTMAGYIPEEGIRSALKHGTIVIGQLGLAEALQLLIGCDHTEEKGMDLAKRIEQLFKDRCAEFKQTYKLNFGVYYTPAENLCYTALKKFRERFGTIENVSDKEFFTNSMHVPVWKKMSPFEKIDIESQLTGYSSAGCITYVELESSIKNNLDALEQLVNYAMDKDIPYFAVNVPNDTCLHCGYTDEINDICPMCGGVDIQRLRRVTGYLTGNYTTAFNLGKQDEVHHRVKHTGVLKT